MKGYEHYLPADYHFVPSYGNEFALLSGGGDSATQRKTLAKVDSGSRDKEGAHGSSSKGKGPPGSTVSSSGSSRRVSGTVGSTAVAVAVDQAEVPGSKTSSAAEHMQQEGVEDAAAAESAAAVEGESSPTAVDGTDAAAAAVAEETDTTAGAAEHAAEQQQQQHQGLDVESSRAAVVSASDAVDAATDVLEDFREFMYFIVSPKVRARVELVLVGDSLDPYFGSRSASCTLDLHAAVGCETTWGAACTVQKLTILSTARERACSTPHALLSHPYAYACRTL